MTPNPAMANDREQNMNDGTLQVGTTANLLRSAATTSKQGNGQMNAETRTHYNLAIKGLREVDGGIAAAADAIQAHTEFLEGLLLDLIAIDANTEPLVAKTAWLNARSAVENC
jgi:hypothetical protein